MASDVGSDVSRTRERGDSVSVPVVHGHSNNVSAYSRSSGRSSGSVHALGSIAGSDAFIHDAYAGTDVERQDETTTLVAAIVAEGSSHESVSVESSLGQQATPVHVAVADTAGDATAVDTSKQAPHSSPAHTSPVYASPAPPAPDSVAESGAVGAAPPAAIGTVPSPRHASSQTQAIGLLAGRGDERAGAASSSGSSGSSGSNGHAVASWPAVNTPQHKVVKLTHRLARVLTSLLALLSLLAMLAFLLSAPVQQQAASVAFRSTVASAVEQHARGFSALSVRLNEAGCVTMLSQIDTPFCLESVPIVQQPVLNATQSPNDPAVAIPVAYLPALESANALLYCSTCGIEFRGV
ncbi:hypothetical protein EON66_10830 [archaeon]|nr:MAG: hypothetical protein EON66_10830 [archaeon]